MNEQAKSSIWSRLVAVLEDLDGAIDPSSREHAKIASLEKRVARLEASSTPHGQPE